MLVVVYEVSRRYGGPEEGGWWYDWTRIVAIRRVRSPGKARAMHRRLRVAFPQPRFDRFSAAGDADYFIRVHSSPGQLWRETTERPQYE